MPQKKRLFAANLALAASVVLLGLKFWAYKLTGSQAVFSDAMESIVNVIAALSLLILLRIAGKPADEDHPYGHGKAEYFSSAFEGGLITFAALMIVIEAADALIYGSRLRELEFGLLIIAAAGAANLALGWYLLRLGRKIHSLALQASGKHILSDFWTTAGVLAALGVVHFTGILWLDPLAALIVGLLLGKTGLSLLKDSAGALMDAEDMSLLRRILELFTRHRSPGIIRIHHTRVIRSGNYHHIDSHVVVPEFWDVTRAHEETDEFEHKFIRDYEFDGEIHFHVDPCRRAYCRACDYPNCPVRREPFKEKILFTIEELRSPIEPEEFK
ncbi:MAG TPA: cation diffusion facilitator family transporter [Bdellovibrionales bacterium]|nr:cation diffusion facilitator family transporter [Bdellovibrionales bacterium]